MSVQSRIAPTPSGFLHLGNAFNFILTYLLVRAADGSLRLRIDDLNTPRIRPEFMADIFDTLHWLGISWQEGPQTPEEAPGYAQINRMDRYQHLLEELVSGEAVFACTCSRTMVLSSSEDGQYPGTCREKGLPLDTPGAAWRLRTPKGLVIQISDQLAGICKVDLYASQRDFIIRRRDGLPGYQLASLADDLDFNINTIVRGEDLLPSTAAQVYLARILKAGAFENASFYHHPLLKGPQGAKLSKSAGSDSLKSIRLTGAGPAGILKQAANWLEGLQCTSLLPKAFLEQLRSGSLPPLKQ